MTTFIIILLFVIIFFLIFITYFLTTTVWSQKKRAYSLLDTLPDLIWLTDKEGRFVYTNNAFLTRILLCSKKNAEGKTIHQLINEQLAKGCINNFDTIFSASNDDVEELKITKKFLEIGKIGDEYVALETTKTPLYSNGIFAGILGSARDVTREVKEHSELERLIEKNDLVGFKKLFNEHKFKYITTPSKSCYPDFIKNLNP